MSASNLRKRRGVVRASITRLGNRLKDLEASSDTVRSSEHAKQLAIKLEALDVDFKALHLQLVDLLEEAEELESEQDTLDAFATLDHQFSYYSPLNQDDQVQ